MFNNLTHGSSVELNNINYKIERKVFFYKRKLYFISVSFNENLNNHIFSRNIIRFILLMIKFFSSKKMFNDLK